ncbi:hypothetical protein BSKO_01055 [Bryopsis sp. KO-2023]|nr:hypothetical protein BSKO_01055 [Bryopsis sp. KO-2023]
MPLFPGVDRLRSSLVQVCAGVLIVVVTLSIAQAGEKELNQEKSDPPEESPAAPLSIVTENGLPSNVSGYYEGHWTSGTIDDRLKRNTRFVRGEKGVFLMELTSGPQRNSGIQVVKGDIVLREEDGLRMSDVDFRMKVEGFFVYDVGRIKAELKTSRPINVRLTPAEIASRGPEYRSALRKEAARWSRTPHPIMKFGRSADEQLEFVKECRFEVDLHATLADEDEGDGSHGLLSGPKRNLLGDSVEKPRLKMLGSLSSPNCNVSLSLNATSFQLEKFYAKSVHYTVVATIVTFAQILLLINQMKVTATPASAMRVSMLSISQQATMDAYLCLLHLTAGIIREPLFNAFAMVSFFEFVLFAIFEMRYMLLVWRAQRGQTLDPWDTRRELSILYTRFYAVLLGGIIFAYRLYKHMNIVIFFSYSFWVPQIFHCIQKDVRQPLRPLFVVGMTICRMMLPLYVYGCPQNLLGVKPNPGLCLGLSFYMFIQVALLLVQSAYGPHCFVPKRFLPDKHDYFRSLDAQELEEYRAAGEGDEETGHSGIIECVICMSGVEIRRPMSRMVTPCGHFFHPQCLQRWMDVKMECPTCRQNLPPL